VQVKYHIGYYHGNFAVVRFGDRLVGAVRKMYFYKTLRTDIEGYPISNKPNEGEISWWGSKVAVCSMDSATLQPIACEDYDPRTWKECLWNKGFEGTGGAAHRGRGRQLQRRQQRSCRDDSRGGRRRRQQCQEMEGSGWSCGTGRFPNPTMPCFWRLLWW
jgi:hypothetical protein